VSAEIKEVVFNSNCCDAKHLLPDIDEAAFKLRTGRNIVSAWSSGRIIRLRQRFAIDFAIWHERQRFEANEG
jgi:hypothetical protein